MKNTEKFLSAISKSSLVTPIILSLYEINLKKRMFDKILYGIMKHALKDNVNANITSAF
jgi:hypothetical protein